jgi:hypothetical protein
MLEEVPVLLRGSIGAGETESLTVLSYRSNLDLVFCSCDVLAIKFLSYLQMNNKGISLEKVLNSYKHKKVNLQPKHSEQHFKNSIEQGNIEFVQNVKLK